VLFGADVHSSYCYLLSPEGQRDGDTWGLRLLGLRERGFDPEATVADFGTGLRKGQKQALPGVPCHGDVFHPLRDVQAPASHLDHRAYQAIARLGDLELRQGRFAWRNGRKDRKLGWLRQDILAVAGPQHATRVMLYDGVVAELRARETDSERIGPVRQMLENHRDELLPFASELDSDLRRLADQRGSPWGWPAKRWPCSSCPERGRSGGNAGSTSGVNWEANTACCAAPWRGWTLRWFGRAA
jgi:hypothetical protein